MSFLLGLFLVCDLDPLPTSALRHWRNPQTGNVIADSRSGRSAAQSDRAQGLARVRQADDGCAPQTALDDDGRTHRGAHPQITETRGDATEGVLVADHARGAARAK